MKGFIWNRTTAIPCLRLTCSRCNWLRMAESEEEALEQMKAHDARHNEGPQ